MSQPGHSDPLFCNGTLISSAETKAEMIARTVWFGSFKRAHVEALPDYLKGYTVSKGQTVFEQGSKESYLCVVAEGAVEVSMSGKLLAKFDSGRSFGEMSLLDGLNRSATAVATADTELFIMMRDDFARVRENDPELAFTFLNKIARLLSVRLRNTDNRLVEFLDDVAE